MAGCSLDGCCCKLTSAVIFSAASFGIAFGAAYGAFILCPGVSAISILALGVITGAGGLVPLYTSLTTKNSLLISISVLVSLASYPAAYLALLSLSIPISFPAVAIAFVISAVANLILRTVLSCFIC